jgi:hypothetical protein
MGELREARSRLWLGPGRPRTDEFSAVSTPIFPVQATMQNAGRDQPVAHYWLSANLIDQKNVSISKDVLKLRIWKNKTGLLNFAPKMHQSHSAKRSEQSAFNIEECIFASEFEMKKHRLTKTRIPREKGMIKFGTQCTTLTIYIEILRRFHFSLRNIRFDPSEEGRFLLVVHN